MKRIDNLELDYLNPTKNKLIDLYINDIRKLEQEFHQYLLSTKNPDPATINHYETSIDLKWDNLKFYKKHMMK